MGISEIEPTPTGPGGPVYSSATVVPMANLIFGLFLRDSKVLPRAVPGQQDLLSGYSQIETLIGSACALVKRLCGTYILLLVSIL
jgi:hypothetical protein